MVKDLKHIVPGQKIINQPEKTINQNSSIHSNGFNDAFDSAIKNSLATNDSSGGISFSKHALDRLRDRNILMDLAKMEKLGGAIEKAAKKGSTESLIISDDSAFIVNIPKRKIITAMDKAQMQDNVFTKIDSTVIA